MTRPILAALLVFAVPAFAEPRFDQAVADACIASEDPAACIGEAARICASADGGSSNVGLGFCLREELAFWDAEMARVYAALGDYTATLDADTAAAGIQQPSIADALQEAQRAWTVWRDASCSYERTLWGGGTGAGPAQAECLMRLTGQRAIALDHDLAGLGG